MWKRKRRDYFVHCKAFSSSPNLTLLKCKIMFSATMQVPLNLIDKRATQEITSLRSVNMDSPGLEKGRTSHHVIVAQDTIEKVST